MSDRLKLRQRLQCKDFSWYLQNLLPNLFPPTPNNLVNTIKIKVNGKSCLRMKDFKHTSLEAIVVPCPLTLSDEECVDKSSAFYYTKTKQLRGTDWPRIGWCLTLSEGNIVMDTCETRNDKEVYRKRIQEQQWNIFTFSEENTAGSNNAAGGVQIKNVATGLCLAVASSTSTAAAAARHLSLEQCSDSALHSSDSTSTTKHSSNSVFETESVAGGIYSGVARVGAFSPLTQNRHTTISVVLPCSGEGELMTKTVQSIIQNTPFNVLKEIIVVDDGSDPPQKTFWSTSSSSSDTSKVKFMRHETTRGLMRARETGADIASGDVVALFDCHVAPQLGWHVEILKEINENYKRVAVPVITSLNVDTWKEISRPATGAGMSACYLTFDGEVSLIYIFFFILFFIFFLKKNFSNFFLGVPFSFTLITVQVGKRSISF